MPAAGAPLAMPRRTTTGLVPRHRLSASEVIVSSCSAMNPLHEKSFIGDPADKAKSVWLTDGVSHGRNGFFREMFAKGRMAVG